MPRPSSKLPISIQTQGFLLTTPRVFLFLFFMKFCRIVRSRRANSEHELQADEVGTRTIISSKRQFPDPPHFRKCRSIRRGYRRRYIDLHYLFDRWDLIHQDQHPPIADVQGERFPTVGRRIWVFYGCRHVVQDRSQQRRSLTVTFLTICHRPLPFCLCHIAPPYLREISPSSISWFRIFSG